MVPSTTPAWLITVTVAVLTLAAMIAAVVLQLTGNDATHAWEAFAGLVVFFGGIHIPSPVQSG